MNALETKLKQLCLDSPHWMQLELQAFWYGLLSITMELAEQGQHLPVSHLSIKDCLHHADPEFASWPTDWLHPIGAEFLQLTLNFDDQQAFFERLETSFQDTIPVDLNLFTVLAEGETLSAEEWERLYDTLAFIPPEVPPKKNFQQKTRRTHGRRAITPLKRRKATTAHKKHPTVHLVKLNPSKG